jgi:hypothetical protein
VLDRVWQVQLAIGSRNSALTPVFLLTNVVAVELHEPWTGKIDPRLIIELVQAGKHDTSLLRSLVRSWFGMRGEPRYPTDG